MSQQLIARSPDLKRLRDDGYEIEVRSNHLVVKNVPYVTPNREVKRGTLVSTLTLAGDITTTPDDHQAHFEGEVPCSTEGSPLSKILNQSNTRSLGPNVMINHSFSAKPKNAAGRYPDYYEKVTTYVAILSGHAQALDPTATAKTFAVVEAKENESPFNYLDTASSRAEIGAITSKLENQRVAILGIGGTGSYVLDFVAKTPVLEIHLFDADVYLQHNAFRAPGAASVEDLQKKPMKAEYFKELYSKMRRGITAHPEHAAGAALENLKQMSFVFICIDDGPSKRKIVSKLEEFGIPFVDVGIGLFRVGDSLDGIVRVTTSTPQKRDHVQSKGRISFSDGDADNEYNKNIQIAELNALNAALAVVKWKKIFGFYVDLEHEHFSTYTIDGNSLGNEDKDET